MSDRLRRLLVTDRWTAATFLASLILGLVGLSIAGRVSASQNQFVEFIRFHRYVNPETFFYPTASEVVAVARAGARSDQVLVIIGGSSIMFGAGQGVDELWTRT